MSRGQISRSCVLPARCLPSRLQYPHGRKARRCAAHGKPVPPGFQPPEICCKRKGQTAHALPQCQKTVVHPCVRQAEQIGGKGRQHCCKAGIAEGKPRITGDHPPALRKRKPCRKPQRHCKQQQIGGPAANFIADLSGGESQRVKLATELSKRDTGKTLYILDEPTTGLHFEDIRILMDVLQKLVDRGNTVIIIEHNLDVIKLADWLIDMGPEGGRGGGQLLFAGTPEEMVKQQKGYTYKFLAPLLKKSGKPE